MIHRRYTRPGEMESEDLFGVYEVFYDEDGRPNGCTEEPVAPVSETAEGLKVALADYQRAFREPVLEYEAFEQKPHR